MQYTWVVKRTESSRQQFFLIRALVKHFLIILLLVFSPNDTHREHKTQDIC